MTLVDLVDLVSRGGVLGLLVVIVYGGMKGWYVWGWAYKDLQQERDEWKAMALRGTNLAQAATGLVEETATARRAKGG